MEQEVPLPTWRMDQPPQSSSDSLHHLQEMVLQHLYSSRPRGQYLYLSSEVLLGEGAEAAPFGKCRISVRSPQRPSASPATSKTGGEPPRAYPYRNALRSRECL